MCDIIGAYYLDPGIRATKRFLNLIGKNPQFFLHLTYLEPYIAVAPFEFLAILENPETRKFFFLG